MIISHNLKMYVQKLRSSNLRPTKQRLKICQFLFDREKTFHFTVNELVKILKNQAKERISLATVYNTVHAFKKKGYLKEILVDSNQSYFDTNTSHHHHFYDEQSNELVDIENKDLEPINIRKNIPGKKIKSVEVLVKVDTDNQYQE